MQVITVCRDKALYKKLFIDNPNINSYNLHLIDNSQQNLGISARYNQFIKNYDFAKPDWFMFCHEDFYLTDSNFTKKLKELNPAYLYGPIGSLKKQNLTADSYQFPFKALLGQLIQCEKDGSQAKTIGQVSSNPAPVDTFDCCCLLVHSSLIHQYSLQFDENLTFDLYVEDFCMKAKEDFGIKSFVFPFECQHWSSGQITERYFKGLRYLSQKFPTALYAGTCSFVGGGTSQFGIWTSVLKFAYELYQRCPRGLRQSIKLLLKRT